MNAAGSGVAIYEALRIELTERVISTNIIVCEQVLTWILRLRQSHGKGGFLGRSVYPKITGKLQSRPDSLLCLASYLANFANSQCVVIVKSDRSMIQIVKAFASSFESRTVQHTNSQFL